MEKQKQNFLRILGAYVNNTPVILNEPDFKEIFKLAKINSLEAIVYSTLKQNKITPEDMDIKRLEVTFNTTVAYSIKQEYVAKELIKLLNDNEIRHIIFKGYVIKHLYKDPELRTMGDIDICIDSSNQEIVKKILVNNGFTYDEINSHAKVWNYKKGNVLFELHSALFENNLFEAVSLREYYTNPFILAINESQMTFVFTKENHLIYMLLHMAKHFKNGGCGIRMLLDIVVYTKTNPKMDYVYLEKELKKLKIYDFYKDMLDIAELLFVTDSSSPNIKEEWSEIVEYMIDGGVFGYEGKNIDAIRTSKNTKVQVSVLRLIFPSYKDITTRYNWANKYPRFLLPICWIKMWFYRLFVVKENSFKRVIDMAKSSNDVVTHRKMLEIVGLHKE